MVRHSGVQRRMPAVIAAPQAAQMTVTRPDTSGEQIVHISTTFNHGSANNGDYVGWLSVPLEFAGGVASLPVTIVINDDGVAESLETFGLMVVLARPAGEPVLASSTFTIADDDQPTGEAFGLGDDWVLITPLSGSQSFNGGTGSDRATVDFSAFATSVTAAGLSGSSTFRVRTGVGDTHIIDVSSIEHFTLLGGSGNDSLRTLTWGGFSSQILTGDDILIGGGGSTLQGGEGNDASLGELVTTSSKERRGSTFSMAVRAMISSPAMPATTRSSAASATIRSMEAGVGHGQLYRRLEHRRRCVPLNFRPQNTGGAGVDTLISIENLNGSQYDDYLTGDGASNGLNGDFGDDHLFGLGDNDLLDGSAGNDTLDGGAGADTMAGGTGNDAYVVDNVGDVVTENSGEGADKLLHHQLYAGRQRREPHTRRVGVRQRHWQRCRQHPAGNSGNNTLDSAGGDDYMAGGAGNDTYFVDSVFDVIVENAGEGIDTVYTNANYIIGANVEQLYLQAAAGAATGVGNSEQNLLVGSSFDNTLDGGINNDQLRRRRRQRHAAGRGRH